MKHRETHRGERGPIRRSEGTLFAKPTSERYVLFREKGAPNAVRVHIDEKVAKALQDVEEGDPVIFNYTGVHGLGSSYSLKGTFEVLPHPPREQRYEEPKWEEDIFGTKEEEVSVEEERPRMSGFRAMGAEAPEDTTEEDLLEELADALASIPARERFEAPEVTSWLPAKGTDHRVAVFDVDERNARVLRDAETGEIIVRAGEERGEGIVWSGAYREGTKIVLETEGEGPYAIVDILGPEDAYKTEVQAFAYEELEAGRQFPEAVRKEVKEKMELGADEVVRREVARLPLVLPEGRNWQKKYEIGKNRVDARGLETITIDPASAKDFDDALSYRKLSNGDIEIWVHSASPIDFARAGSASFQEAMRRGTSVYLKGTVIPMMHPFYSGGKDIDGTHHEGIASLVQGKDRVVNSLVFTFRHGKLSRQDPVKVMAVIRSNKRFTYDEAQKVVDGELESPHKEMLEVLTKFGRKERKQRYKRGQINLPERSEWNFEDGENGETLASKERNEMMMVVEDYMVLANDAQGRRLLEAAKKYAPDLPGVFRVHEPPTLAELRDAAVSLGQRDVIELIDQEERNPSHQGKIPFENMVMRRILNGIELSKESVATIRQGVFGRRGTEEEAQKVIEAHQRERERTAMPILLRLVTAAHFSTKPKGHFALSSEWYTQWTSPMRRAVDNIVEFLDRTRQYKERGGEGKNMTPFDPAVLGSLEPLLDRISERSVRAKKAEQTSLRMYATERLARTIGDTLTLRVVSVRMREGEMRGLVIRVPLPGSSYEQDYLLPPESIVDFPTNPDALRALRGKQEVILTAADVREGTISIKLKK